MTDEQPLTLDDLKEQIRSLEPAGASNEIPRELIPHDLEIAFQLGQLFHRISTLEEAMAKLQRQQDTEHQRAWLRDDGYTRQAGDPGDQAVAEAATCGACGLKGQRYEAWRSYDSYRAFAVCPRCGAREEF